MYKWGVVCYVVQVGQVDVICVMGGQDYVVEVMMNICKIFDDGIENYINFLF